MKCLFALSMLLAGLMMTALAPMAWSQTSPHKTASGNTCDFGESLVAAQCYHDNGNGGQLGSSQYGVYGENGSNWGALGSEFYGAYGVHTNGPVGFLGGSGFGAVGEHTNGNYGTLGSSSYGAYGAHSNGNYGFLGGLHDGAVGLHTNGNLGILGDDDYGVWGTGSPWAGYFVGNVHITGTLSGGSAASKIDHPLDPANRYLSQSFVESPEMKQVYDGTVMLDVRGEAVVELPAYVEVLNRDFRYQLTAIGAPGPNLYIAEEITGNQFRIAGGKPDMKVSWQVTGIRQDAWAEENRIIVEEDKPAKERGFYLYPKLFGQSEERGIMWAQQPEVMRMLPEMPARLEAEQARMKK